MGLAAEARSRGENWQIYDATPSMPLIATGVGEEVGSLGWPMMPLNDAKWLAQIKLWIFIMLPGGTADTRIEAWLLKYW